MEGLDLKGERESDVLVMIDGKAGAGKDVLADYTAEKLGAKRVSAGEIFRQAAEEKGLDLEELSGEARKELDLDVDRKIFEKGLSESCVIDSRIGSRVLDGFTDLKLRLKADPEERGRRVAKRENIGREEALKKVEKRDRSDAERYARHYGIDLDDLSVYDIVIDDTELSVEETKKLMDRVLEVYIR
ncbi:MAG: (d)CMP kinase [Candidatus Nanohaloarchaea archaeon]